MRVAILAATAFAALFVTSAAVAQLPRVSEGRPYTSGVGPQPYGYPPQGYGVYSGMGPYQVPGALGSPPKSEYLWPPFVTQNYIAPYGYPAAPYAGPAYGWQAPRSYNRYFNGYRRGYSPHRAYRDRRYASPRYQPRAGGMFER